MCLRQGLAVITGKTPETCNKTLRESGKLKRRKKIFDYCIEAAEHLEIDVEIILAVIGR